jgi:serine/threonine-protein kinase
MAGQGPVAVKLPLEPLDDEGAARLAREVELLTSVRHPRLAQLLACWLDADGRPGLVYELVEGRPLHEVLGDGGPELAMVLGWTRDVAVGLDALAAEGLVHRDLKPSNLILEPSGRVRILDFGLARQTSGGTVTMDGMVLGTPAFMAPEQLLEAKLSPACDIYSLGCLVYQFLTGAPPFDGSPGELLRSHTSTTADPVSRRRTGLGPGVDRVVARALEKDPTRRYPSAGALASALEGALEDADAEAPEATRLVESAIAPKAGQVAAPRRGSLAPPRLDVGPWPPLPWA